MRTPIERNLFLLVITELAFLTVFCSLQERFQNSSATYDLHELQKVCAFPAAEAAHIAKSCHSEHLVAT